MADVLLGYLFTHEDLGRWWVFGLLLAASSLLYAAGIVLNDVFDLEVDARQRPGRPLPSGRVSPARASSLGFGLLLFGAASGWAAGAVDGQVQSGVVATALALAVLLYDRVLKRTPLGPPAMGACRLLNVLLGMSASAAPWHAVHWLVAAGIGTYIAGVTWFARTEAGPSSRRQLALAMLVMAGGLGLLAWFPSWSDLELAPVSAPIEAVRLGGRWQLWWTVIGVLVGWRCVRAVVEPAPHLVQQAVKQCLLSLVVLDAAVCFAVRGAFWATVIVLLLLPAMFLGRWIYST